MSTDVEISARKASKSILRLATCPDPLAAIRGTLRGRDGEGKKKGKAQEGRSRGEERKEKIGGEGRRGGNGREGKMITPKGLPGDARCCKF